MHPIAIAAPSALSAGAAELVVQHGGGAVDAAVAAAVAAMVSEPGIVAPGAGGFATVWPAGGSPVTHDGYMAVPGLGGRHPDPQESTVTLAYGGGVTTIVGPASIAVPGIWAALGDVHAEHGRVPWATVLGPAIGMAAEGTPLGSTASHYFDYSLEPIFDLDPVGRRALRGEDGRPLRPGDRVMVAGLAESLDAIAELGAAEFYTGELGRAIVDDLGKRGSHLSAADFEGFRVERRSPLLFEHDGWTFATNPAPAVGGAALVALMALAGDGSTAAQVTAQRHVYGWRRSGADAAEDRAAAVAHLLAGLPGDPIRSPSTAHVSAAGGGVACSISLSAGYGSGVIPSGTGLWMNNGLGELELVGDRRRLPPGARLNSNMAPTIGRHGDGRIVAIGSPGADRITSAIAQVLLRLSDGLEPDEAVAAPRVHVDVGTTSTVAWEPGIDLAPGISGDMALRRYDDLHMYFGGVGLAMQLPDGTSIAATDPRRNGATAVI
jgi:gamma-glutamyltranspeptidase / glutathione hydrolase